MNTFGRTNAEMSLRGCIAVATVWCCAASTNASDGWSNPPVPQKSVIRFASDSSFTFHDDNANGSNNDASNRTGNEWTYGDTLPDQFDLRKSVHDTAAARRRTLQQFSGMTPQISTVFDEATREEMSYPDLPVLPTNGSLPATFSRVEARMNDLQRLLEQLPACSSDTFPPVTKSNPESVLMTPRPVSEPVIDSPADLPLLDLPSLDLPPIEPATEVLPRPSFSEVSENANRDQLDALDDVAEPEPIVDAIAITKAPVDRMSLANNLYGAGEFELALTSYQELGRLAGLTPQEQVWVRYQIGNCFQRMGNQQEAQRSLRRVASVTEKSIWGQHAHWWLDTNDRTNRLQTQIEELQHKIDQIKGLNDEPYER